MENELFDLAVQASTRVPPKNVIGTQSEYRLHGALKYYFQPDDRFHEIKVDGFICDAVSEDGDEIIEIQTRAFSRLKKKIETLTKEHKVTVIYPMTVEKTVYVTYDDSGETSVRKSPKKHRPVDFFTELYSLRDYLGNKNLCFRLAVLKCNEFRVYKGTKAGRKPFQKPISTERIPTELIEVIELNTPSDFYRFVPEKLPEYFNSDIFAKASGITRNEASYLLKPLTVLGVLNRTGKVGNSYIYEVTDKPSI